MATFRLDSPEAHDNNSSAPPLLTAPVCTSLSSPPPAGPIALVANVEPSTVCPSSQVVQLLTPTNAIAIATASASASASAIGSASQVAAASASPVQAAAGAQQQQQTGSSPNQVADAPAVVVPQELQERVPEWRQHFPSAALLGLFASATERREASVRALSSDLKRHLRALYERCLAQLGPGASDAARVEAALGAIDYQQQPKLRIYFEIVAYLCSEPCYNLFVTALVRVRIALAQASY